MSAALRVVEIHEKLCGATIDVEARRALPRNIEWAMGRGSASGESQPPILSLLQTVLLLRPTKTYHVMRLGRSWETILRVLNGGPISERRITRRPLFYLYCTFQPPATVNCAIFITPPPILGCTLLHPIPCLPSSYQFSFRVYYHVARRGNENVCHVGNAPYGPAVGLMANHRCAHVGPGPEN